MKSKTSNTVFLGGLVAGIALASVVVAPAHAQTASQDNPQDGSTFDRVEPAPADPAPVETLCVDTLCYDLPAKPVLPGSVLDSIDMESVRDNTVPVLDVRRASYSGDSSVIVRNDFDGADTLIGKLDRTAPPSAADELLSGNGYMPTNDDIQPIGSVAGVGLRSTF